jgi:hypothetical protein
MGLWETTAYEAAISNQIAIIIAGIAARTRDERTTDGRDVSNIPVLRDIPGYLLKSRGGFPRPHKAPQEPTGPHLYPERESAFVSENALTTPSQQIRTGHLSRNGT